VGRRRGEEPDARGAEAETRALLEETRSLDPNEASIADVTRTWPSYAAAFTAGLATIQRQDWLATGHASREALRHDPQSADAWEQSPIGADCEVNSNTIIICSGRESCARPSNNA
jgi:hypothetical protein